MKTTHSMLRTQFVVVTVALLFARGADAAKLTTSSGELDFNYGDDVAASGGEGTAYKPESKLFYTTEDEIWWAVLGTSKSSAGKKGVFLYTLNAAHHWHEVLQFPGADPWAKADVLYQSGTLYVSLRDNRSLSGNSRQSLLYRVDYLGNGQWDKPKSPTLITTSNPETLVIARDSLSRIWTAYENSQRIRVGHTSANATTFSFEDLSTPSVGIDDIATIFSFGNTTRRIGVLWSDQQTERIGFAWRLDSDPLATSAWHFETAYGGGVGNCSSRCADDHLNAKVAGDEIYVATKTSRDDPADADPDDPLIVLLHRSATGTWSAFPVSPVSANATRPIVLVAPPLNLLWVFTTRGSNVDVWESSLSSPRFTSAPTVWTNSETANATSTRQPITATSGAVVETSAAKLNDYWHNEFLATPPPPKPKPTPTPLGGFLPGRGALR